MVIPLERALQEPTDTPPDLESGKLETFAEAAVKIDRLASDWAPSIRRAENPDHAEFLRSGAESEMAAAIEETDGMTLDTFRTIYYVALSDAEIAGKLRNLLESETSSSIE